MVPVKQIEYGVYWGSDYNIPKARFYLLKGNISQQTRCSSCNQHTGSRKKDAISPHAGVLAFSGNMCNAVFRSKLMLSGRPPVFLHTPAPCE